VYRKRLFQRRLKGPLKEDLSVSLSDGSEKAHFHFSESVFEIASFRSTPQP
jgi:hypothetical protein